MKKLSLLLGLLVSSVIGFSQTITNNAFCDVRITPVCFADNCEPVCDNTWVTIPGTGSTGGGPGTGGVPSHGCNTTFFKHGAYMICWEDCPTPACGCGPIIDNLTMDPDPMDMFNPENCYMDMGQMPVCGECGTSPIVNVMIDASGNITIN